MNIIISITLLYIFVYYCQRLSIQQMNGSGQKLMGMIRQKPHPVFQNNGSRMRKSVNYLNIYRHLFGIFP